MNFRGQSKERKAFSLIELLVVVAIIGVLAVMVVANWGNFRLYSQRTASLNNMRQIGVAFYRYAGDNDYRLPGRTKGTNDRWPKLLSVYLDDPKVYAAVGDRSNYLFKGTDPLDNGRNNTSYIMNGYNDIGSLTNDGVEVRLSGLPNPADVLLLGSPKSGSTHFYMDMLEGKNGNHIDVLNLQLYGEGSDYLFADGSARYLKTNEYRVEMWLVNKDFEIP